ncbi:MAG: 3-dehydroquinate synthase [Granulosicoccus sp.]|nr:3-dehydroquinate synthase [Granulosicoccus sp.]
MNTSNLQRVDIDLGKRSYPIFIGSGLLQRRDLLEPYLNGRVMIVTNDTIAPLYLNTLLTTLDGLDVESVVLPDGEEHKNLAVLDQIFESLLTHRFDRGCTLVALGGGVVGDMAGFAAASYQRGINFIQIPTTLLAQVDSSVGGKTAVNHTLGKNMIGAFHQPQVVLADMDALQSLPIRELKAGLAEVIKYGFILDSEFFDWLESHVDQLLARDPQAIGHAVKRSCEIKAEVVAEDEQERGTRALLNFGHTFGHAIEGGMGYGKWLHGEAISAGMVMALDLSQRLGMIGGNTHQRGVDLLDRSGLPISPPNDLSADQLLDYMNRDKKVMDGKLRFILLDAIGEARVVADVDNSALRATLEQFQ